MQSAYIYNDYVHNTYKQDNNNSSVIKINSGKKSIRRGKINICGRCRTGSNLFFAKLYFLRRCLSDRRGELHKHYEGASRGRRIKRRFQCCRKCASRNFEKDRATLYLLIWRTGRGKGLFSFRSHMTAWRQMICPKRFPVVSWAATDAVTLIGVKNGWVLQPRYTNLLKGDLFFSFVDVVTFFFSC